MKRPRVKSRRDPPWDGIAYGSYVEGGRIVTFRMDDYKRQFLEPMMAEFDRMRPEDRAVEREG